MTFVQRYHWTRLCGGAGQLQLSLASCHDSVRVIYIPQQTLITSDLRLTVDARRRLLTACFLVHRRSCFVSAS
jgi:hypothetical protein